MKYLAFIICGYMQKKNVMYIQMNSNLLSRLLLSSLVCNENILYLQKPHFKSLQNENDFCSSFIFK